MSHSVICSIPIVIGSFFIIWFIVDAIKEGMYYRRMRKWEREILERKYARDQEKQDRIIAELELIKNRCEQRRAACLGMHSYEYVANKAC